MRVAMYCNNNDIRIEEMPIPEPGRGELLLKVEACGICGSDVMEWYRIKKAPLVLGHEVAGIVAGAGEGVTQYKKGDRVAVCNHVPCNLCRYCLSGHHTVCDIFRSTHFNPGGFAEFMPVAAINVERGVYLLPDHISFEEGTFVEPLACVVRGQRLAGMQAGKSVFVIGTGVTGILHIMLARASGAVRIIATDISDYRLKMAVKFGADAVIPVSNDMASPLRTANSGRLADLVIVCTGAAEAILQSWKTVERGGTILLFAPPAPGTVIPLPIHERWFDEVTVLSSYSGSPLDASNALELISQRRLNVRDMITHHLSLAEAGLGFRLMTQANESLKIIIEPQR